MTQHNPVISANADQPLYQMASTFLNLPVCTDLNRSDADVIISGIPFDMATSGRAGSRFGPQGVRLASANLSWEGARWPWQFAMSEVLQVEDIGDIQFKHGEPQTMLDNAYQHCHNILASGKSCLTFGGDHFVSLPLLRAHAAYFGKISVIHFDAHTDNYSGGSQYDHGTLFHHAVVEGTVDPETSIQIGIRTSYDQDNHPFQVLDAATCNDIGVAEVIAKIKQRVGDRPAYLSFDIDGLDPAYAPGTGTPVVGGLTTDFALKMIRGLVDVNLIGADVVEVAPAYDHADITSLAGATVALEYLNVQAARKLSV